MTTEFHQGNNYIGGKKDAFLLVIVSHFMKGIFTRLNTQSHIRIMLYFSELPEAQKAYEKKLFSATG